MLGDSTSEAALEGRCIEFGEPLARDRTSPNATSFIWRPIPPSALFESLAIVHLPAMSVMSMSDDASVSSPRHGGLGILGPPAPAPPPRGFAKLETKAQAIARSVKTLAATLNSAPVTLAAVSRECSLIADSVAQAGRLPHAVPGIEELVWPLSNLLSQLQSLIDRIPYSEADDSQLVIIYNEDAIKKALGSLKAIGTSLNSFDKDTTAISVKERQLCQLLHLAIDKKKCPAVAELLQQGADPNLRRAGSPLLPLHRAINLGDEDMASTLATAGASVNTPDDDDHGRSALNKALVRGFSGKFVSLVLELGAKIDATDDSGSSVLHLAALLNREDDTIGTLILAGADVNARDKQGFTPLATAVSKSRYTSARQLLEYGSDLETKLPGEKPILHLAIQERDQALCDLLVEWEANLEEEYHDHTPLTFAITMACFDIAHSLINAGADINKRSGNGNFPLLSAISAEHVALTNQLLSLEASVNVEGREAVKLRNKETIDFLIDVGADLNHRINPKETMLSIAVEACNKAITQTLINAGADTTALLIDDDGHETTPFHVAAEYGLNDILRLMADSGANLESTVWPGYTPLFSAVRAGNLPTVKTLVRSGASTQARSLAGETVLFVATANVPMLKYLLELGINVNHRDHYGATALHHAGSHGRIASAKVLLQAGARSLHANVVYDSLEDFRVGSRYRQGTPAGIARQRATRRWRMSLIGGRLSDDASSA
ncbi:unnamed protein product [Parascedosporium putredinis]|uniref:Ankyrin n=1 Tax=Parascedosporium putredinis TaxID=1442378 RepID=A0A9P1GWG3_9PEZI|nr:unnamed protein product [Parascedosporium putredinis]CAI7989507.1 unnamed protein product [Parascedosporium putredinis]